SGPGWKSSCCPKFCGFDIDNPIKGNGAGCCDHDETCVGHSAPNTRDGCCPVGRYCGGNCCAAGENCFGDTFCPANYFCLDGFCSEFPGRSLWPEHPKPAKPPEGTIGWCKIGWEPCGATCCPPGLQCCSEGGGRVACKANCLA